MTTSNKFILPGERGLDGILLKRTRNSSEEIKAQANCFKLVYDNYPGYVNDHCVFIDKDGVLHLFHITGTAGQSWSTVGNEVTIGHAITRDLQTWEVKPDLLSPNPSSTFETDHVYAPFVIDNDGHYFMFYAGNNTKAMIESMCVAVSSDLYTWDKHPSNPIFRPSKYWADYEPNSGVWGCCRDPHVIRHPKYGFILYYVSWIKNTNGRLVSLGAAVSDNLVSWQDAGPVHIRERALDYSTTSMESPCVIEKEGLFYLFYKHHDETRLVVSDDPLSFTDKEDLWFSPAHAGEIFNFKGQWYISSCSREVMDTGHLYSDRTKGLYLAKLDWNDVLPVVRPFDE